MQNTGSECLGFNPHEPKPFLQSCVERDVQSHSISIAELSICGGQQAATWVRDPKRCKSTSAVCSGPAGVIAERACSIFLQAQRGYGSASCG